jgi:serine/threonine protein kinase
MVCRRSSSSWVEGETLAKRLQRGAPALPEALAIARQIADALENAHEKGIIHRDLKPANINVTPDGVVKVLDFGLAKAASGDPAGIDLTQSQTVTVGSTLEGIILGTAAYMSPEQARGQVVDKRTDIWAFGCVLYEMLAGRTAFRRPDADRHARRTSSDASTDWRNSRPEPRTGPVSHCSRLLQR